MESHAVQAQEMFEDVLHRVDSLHDDTDVIVPVWSDEGRA